MIGVHSINHTQLGVNTVFVMKPSGYYSVFFAPLNVGEWFIMRDDLGDAYVGQLIGKDGDTYHFLVYSDDGTSMHPIEYFDFSHTHNLGTPILEYKAIHFVPGQDTLWDSFVWSEFKYA